MIDQIYLSYNMENIFEKIINCKLDTLTHEEHKLLNSYNENYRYNWTKQFWSYINNKKQHSIYWPELKSNQLFDWNVKMIEYYNNDVKYIDIVEPVHVIFNYDVYLQDTRFGDMGKYVHYNKNMTSESWNIKKAMFKEIIRDGLYNKIKRSTSINNIKIYNIRIKDHIEYDSDDDSYGFYKKDIKPHISNLIKKELPKIPDMLTNI